MKTKFLYETPSGLIFLVNIMYVDFNDYLYNKKAIYVIFYQKYQKII